MRFATRRASARLVLFRRTFALFRHGRFLPIPVWMAPPTRTIAAGLEGAGDVPCPWSDSQGWIPPVMKRVDALRHEAGFTIIEVMVAIVILLLGVLATTTLLNTANAETERNQARNGATNLVRDIIEASRALPYDQVNPTVNVANAADNTIVTALQTMAPNGASATTSSFSDQETTPGWQITRRNLTYTVTLKA